MDNVEDAHKSTCGFIHEKYPLLWIARSVHSNKRGQAMSFADKPYLIPLYMEILDYREVVVCKATQTGISELLIQLVLFASGWKNRICAYVLPKQEMCNRFAQDRIEPVILRTPEYKDKARGGVPEGQKLKGRTERRAAKSMGERGGIILLGSNVESEFVEFSCDIAIIDELDTCEQEHLGKLPDRLRASDYPQQIWISNPRIPGGGIQDMWEKGTQGRWMHVCPHCKTPQAMDWFTHYVEKDKDGRWIPRDMKRHKMPVHKGDLRARCPHCEEFFQPDGTGGYWHHAHPDPKRKPSFLISRMDVLPSKSRPTPMREGLKEFLAAVQSIDTLIAWYSGFLGINYEGEAVKMTPDMIRRASTGKPLDHTGEGDDYDKSYIAMGVDQGKVLNVKVSKVEVNEDDKYVRRTVWAGAVREFEELHSVVERYGVDVCVIDAMPEMRKANEFRMWAEESTECQVYLCFFQGTPRVSDDEIGMKIAENNVVKVDRTQLLDTTLAEMRDGRNILPEDINTVLTFSEQMCAPARKWDAKKQRYLWDEGRKADHYRFADAYERVAVELVDRGAIFH